MWWGGALCGEGLAKAFRASRLKMHLKQLKAANTSLEPGKAATGPRHAQSLLSQVILALIVKLLCPNSGYSGPCYLRHGCEFTSRVRIRGEGTERIRTASLPVKIVQVPGASFEHRSSIVILAWIGSFCLSTGDIFAPGDRNSPFGDPCLILPSWLFL